MATEVPEIQVLSRNNYEEQHIVPLPAAYPLPALGPSSLRIKSTILAITTNNFSYARFGHMLGWWDIHPLPPSIPTEYSSPEKFGRISAWGYGVVMESTKLSIGVGTQVFGYLPIGTLPVDMEVKINRNAKNQFWEVSKHRAHVLSIYNRYYLYPPFKNDQERLQSRDKQGMDALFFLFATGYCINRFLFAWDPKELVFPSGNASDGWSLEKAKLGPNSVVLVFSASGKTALSFAYSLKHGRPAGNIPRMVIGVSSEASRAFTEGTGLYDKVLPYDNDSGDLSTELGLHDDSKIAICDFGARDSAADRWAAKLLNSRRDVVQLGIGGEVCADSPEKATEKFMNMKTSEVLKPTMNASAVMSQAMEVVGEQRYWDEYENAFQAFKDQGGVKGMRLVWSYSMVDLGKGWERLYKGEVGPDEGLVFDLNGKSKERI